MNSFAFVGMESLRLLYNKHQLERETRVRGSITRVGSAVFMAAFTTFAAGFSMTLSALCSFQQMGQFLMTISRFRFVCVILPSLRLGHSRLVLTSWLFATFFFLPLCAIIGPVGECGSIPFSRIRRWLKRTIPCCHSRPQSNADARG